MENGAIHTIIFINRQQFHESLVCAAVASIALDDLWLVPLTVPTLLTLSGVTLGILLTCTLHIPQSPGIYQGNPAQTQVRGLKKAVSLEMRCQAL